MLERVQAPGRVLLPQILLRSGKPSIMSEHQAAHPLQGRGVSAPPPPTYSLHPQTSVVRRSQAEDRMMLSVVKLSNKM